jgi:hypothetical protein
MAFSDPEEEGYPVKRRTLRRTFAVAVAIAAISPLFAADSLGCARGSIQTRSIRQNRILQPTDFSLH